MLCSLTEQAGQGWRVLVTYGRSKVLLEVRAMHILDNFSSERLRAASAEVFLAAGYILVLSSLSIPPCPPLFLPQARLSTWLSFWPRPVAKLNQEAKENALLVLLQHCRATKRQLVAVPSRL